MEEEHKVVLSGKAGEVDYLHSLHGQIGKPKANMYLPGSLDRCLLNRRRQNSWIPRTKVLTRQIFIKLI